MTTERIKELEEQLAIEKSKELYCVFHSPGTFLTERNSVKAPDQTDLGWACAQAKTILQRHGARPFGFVFQDGNGKLLGGMHYLGGKLIKLEDVPGDDEHRIMRSNMESSPVVIENTNSYRFTGEFFEGSVLLDPDTGEILRRGDDADLVAYRKKVKEENQITQ